MYKRQDEGNVVMERQFRYPVGEVVLEIPAGKLDDPEEDRLQAAKRELQEETGILAKEWIELGEYRPAPAYSNEVITLYLARDFQYGSQSLDDDEFLNIEQIPLQELVQQVMDGTLTDGKSQVAILKTAAIVKRV